METYTLYLATTALACFFTLGEARRYAFDLGLLHPEWTLTILPN